MRISDWSSDVCSSDLDPGTGHCGVLDERTRCARTYQPLYVLQPDREQGHGPLHPSASRNRSHNQFAQPGRPQFRSAQLCFRRSEEHTSELQSLMRISYAVFCLKKKKKKHKHTRIVTN